jgi:hypothetical protein
LSICDPLQQKRIISHYSTREIPGESNLESPDPECGGSCLIFNIKKKIAASSGYLEKPNFLKIIAGSVFRV